MENLWNSIIFRLKLLPLESPHTTTTKSFSCGWTKQINFSLPFDSLYFSDKLSGMSFISYFCLISHLLLSLFFSQLPSYVFISDAAARRKLLTASQNIPCQWILYDFLTILLNFFLIWCEKFITHHNIAYFLWGIECVTLSFMGFSHF